VSDLNKRFSIDESRISWRLMGDQAMILDLDSGFTYSLNQSGALIWQGIGKERTLAEILKSLKEAYDLREESLLRDLLSLLRELETAGLVVPAKAS